jgi:hypothetical protein
MLSFGRWNSDTKVIWDSDFSSIYHLADGTMIILCNNRNRKELSKMLLEEEHRWKNTIWLVGSSLRFSSNFEMFEGNLAGIFNQVASCKMGSFVSLVKYEMFRDAKYNKFEVGATMVCDG